MKDVTTTGVRNYIGYGRILLSSLPADGRHSIDGLSKLVMAQLNYAPREGQAYLFLVKNQNDRVKVLTKTPDATNIMEMYGERAQKLIRICELCNRLKANVLNK